MFLENIKTKSDKIFNKYALSLYNIGLTPHRATFVSFIFTLIAIYFFIKGKLFLGGIMLIGDYFFDFLDGVIARNTNSKTTTGLLIDKANDLFRVSCWIAIAYSGNISYMLASLAILTSALGFFIGNLARLLELKTMNWLPCWADWFLMVGAILGYIILFAQAMIIVNSVLIVANMLSIIILNTHQRE